jgi:hypothetical protein
MARLFASTPHHAAIRAEMRELGFRARRPYSTLVFGIVAAADTASTVLSLSGL